MAANETIRATETPLERLRAEQVRLLYANGGFPMVVTGAVSTALASLLVYLGALELKVALIWIGAVFLHTALRLVVRAGYLRTNPRDADWRRWANFFVAGSLAGGLTWGVGSLWLLIPGRFDLQMLLVTVLIAIVYGTMTGFGSYLLAFFVLFLPAMAPTVIWFALQGDVLHYACFGFFVLWMPTVVILARRYNLSLVRALQLQFANEALVEDLIVQKAIADQANLAKSRFLASASHDLRQPVHALGMFIGALRSHKLPRRTVDLIDHMDGSIAGLDSLFASLLDISKLDAGVVESHVTAVPLQPLLARICRDLQGEAAAKGLRLTLAPTSGAVLSDPVLLERSLRNLIGNAVRYTEMGRVLVGCRRRGDQVRLEVWDTGPGIAPDQREAVFEEFYQLANPDRDRAKGLGLGLAIVRRLTTMLRHPLELESSPGRGSVFRIEAPKAVWAARAEPPDTPGAMGLKSGLILAIDDEGQIRTAMAELLRSWGHRVVVAANGESALAMLENQPAPDLIICDYRLREGANGVDVIRALRQEFGRGAPALLVTGETAAENLRDALASGIPLLHKPLSHARLRAAVTSLIRRTVPVRAAG
jgi:signal transduction histidine kinase/CheY-like chemotaxis protein